MQQLCLTSSGITEGIKRGVVAGHDAAAGAATSIWGRGRGWRVLSRGACNTRMRGGGMFIILKKTKM